MKLHYSQTRVHQIVQFPELNYHMKLHYSQTDGSYTVISENA